VATKLIVGLGNIGREYENTRHNAGFVLIDAFAATQHVTWHDKAKFKANIAELNLNGTKIILAKPTTFMNLSGEAVRALKNFYKIENSDILVIHDELDLPLGTIRTRIGGSSAGNNGIKSISAHINEDYARMRVGIAEELLAKMGAHDFVLGRFSHEDLLQLRHIEPTAATIIEEFVRGNFAHETHK
jgi:PTH1 family peptidyl-tRNA hydrolase